MTLSHQRDTFTPESTLGKIFIGNLLICETLELPYKDGLPGSAIPQGRYPVIITFSNRFQREMPLLLNIPGRSSIRIHWGNTEADTEGCILVGLTRGSDLVGESRLAFEKLWNIIEASARAGSCLIDVIGAPPAENQPLQTP